MPIQIRRSAQRGYFDYGWLKTFHTFSFGDYQDSDFGGFRSLRAMNENFVQPAVGFPLHAQQDMEIFSIVLEGGMSHQDDLGNASILRPGKIPLLSAGRGATHSEINASDKEIVHFYQIWITPSRTKLKPSYQEKYFDPSERHNRLNLILSGDGRNGSMAIHQDVSVYLSNLDQGSQLNLPLEADRYGWLQVMEGQVFLNGEELRAGDGASINQLSSPDLKAQAPAKIIFFDFN